MVTHMLATDLDTPVMLLAPILLARDLLMLKLNQNPGTDMDMLHTAMDMPHTVMVHMVLDMDTTDTLMESKLVKIFLTFIVLVKRLVHPIKSILKENSYLI